MLDKQRPNCPECGHPMHKHGLGWSGRRKVQTYKCSHCGRVIYDTKKGEKTNGNIMS